MTELRGLRPYLDLLVDQALERVPERPAERPRRALTPRRWVVAVAVVVLAVVVIAVVLTRSTVSSRSVRVPPAQQQLRDDADLAPGPSEARNNEVNGLQSVRYPLSRADQIRMCLAAQGGSSVPAGTVWGAADLATGELVPMSYEEYCEGQVDQVRSFPFLPMQFAAAGVSPQVVFKNRAFVTRYVEVIRETTPEGTTTDVVTLTELAPDEVAARVAEAEATLTAVEVPDEIANVWRSARNSLQQLTPGTTPRAFAVGDATPFVLATLESTPRTGRPAAPAITLLHQGTLATGGQGTGISGQPIPLSDIEAGKPAVFTSEAFPNRDQQLWVWTRLPAHTAYVTMTYDGATYWQRPVAGTAAFVTAIPERIENAPVSATDPVADFTAYDAYGNTTGASGGHRR